MEVPRKFVLIREEVNRRFAPKINELQLPFQGGQGLEQIQNWINNLRNINAAVAELDKVINEVISEPAYKLTNEEIDEFKSYVVPIVTEQLKEFGRL